MQRLVSLIALASVAALVYGAPTTTGMALWERAVGLVGKNLDYLPASIHTKVLVTDGSGNTKDAQETWSKITVGDQGAIKTTVVRSIKNGEDNTENAQKQADKNPQRSRFEYSFLPMTPENQSKVQVEPTGRVKRVDGAACEGFSFSMEGERNQKTVGTVWIDETSAAPLLMEFSFDPLPTGAKVVRNELHFAVGATGIWHLVSMSSYGEGQILFFHRTFSLEMKFSDYFAYSPKGTAAGTSP